MYSVKGTTMGRQITYYVSDCFSKDIRVYAKSLGLDIVIRDSHNSYVINPGDDIESNAYIIYFYDSSVGKTFLNSETSLIDDSASPVRFLYKGIIINHNKKPSQPTLKRRFFKKKAAFFSWPGLGKEWC